MSGDPVFPLLRPERLPGRAEVQAYVSGNAPGVPAELADTLRADAAAALDALRAALITVPLPAGTAPVCDDPGESGGNRDNDQSFDIVRVDGERAAILLHSTLKGAELLLDDAVRSGTDLAPEHWRALRHGFAALLGHLAGFPTPSPGTDPGPGPRGADGLPSDALRRWVRGHRIFMVLIQGLVIAVDELTGAVARADTDQAAEALDLAVSLMRASEAALRFAGDFTPEEYEDLVRPTLMPPAAPPGLSGLHWRDHEYLVKRLAEARQLLAGVDPSLVPLRARFREAYAAAYDAHRFVCARFVGEDVGSLLMTPKSKKSAVGVLTQYKRVRLQHIPD
ncbi:hypothetical protein [Streptomyces sp. ISL-100]|uniref:hypothetical protein n=1 Tax=Streptomyces sp. ISL-100 TaxID=2819173 RepID=UPI001BE9D431|nr:hypothetical protein [Streptomyces sp. ISL-100]MBT2400794.1 hypothetical protein [Streptomyces sp. ISL-100]